MALGTSGLLPRLCSFPTAAAPLRSSFNKFISFSISFLPPPSSQLHSHPVLLARLSSPLSDSLSPAPITTDGDLEEKEEEERRKPLTPPSQATDIAPLPIFPTPQLTIKEKKELASYAHSLGKKLKSQQIGKSGVTSSVAAAMVESLDSNELLKLKVHGSCPGELSDVIKQLESSTGSTAVSQVGRTLILYRPSPVKMNEEDAKRSRMLQRQKKSHIKSVAALSLRRRAQESGTFS